MFCRHCQVSSHSSSQCFPFFQSHSRFALPLRTREQFGSCSAPEVGKNNKVCVCVGFFFSPPAGSTSRSLGHFNMPQLFQRGDWSVCEAMHRWSNRLAAHPQGEFFPEYNVSLSTTKISYVYILMSPPILDIYFEFSSNTGQCTGFPCKLWTPFSLVNSAIW